MQLLRPPDERLEGLPDFPFAPHYVEVDSGDGVLVLCDPRLLGRGYGRVFLDSLPRMPRTDDIRQVRDFFASTGQHGVVSGA